MQIVDFLPGHAMQAHVLACANYAEERGVNPLLPGLMPDTPRGFAENGLGVAAFDGARMLGFLGCYPPWENAFTGTARGTFSPIEAHGAVPEQRDKIYRLLYQAAAEKWVKAGIASHSIALYAHDAAALRAFFTCGFGLRCVDAIRGMEDVVLPSCAGPAEGVVPERQDKDGVRSDMPQGADYVFEEFSEAGLPLVAPLGAALARHLGKSPCFMVFPQAETEASWLAHAAERKSRFFAATYRGAVAAFLEVAAEGENFATRAPDMANICGAYCLPEHRGKAVMPRLLNQVLGTLRRDGYTRLGVDYESFNLAAQGFWPKYFMPYTNGVVRRIDENAFR